MADEDELLEIIDQLREELELKQQLIGKYELAFQQISSPHLQSLLVQENRLLRMNLQSAKPTRVLPLAHQLKKLDVLQLSTQLSAYLKEIDEIALQNSIYQRTSQQQALFEMTRGLFDIIIVLRESLFKQRDRSQTLLQSMLIYKKNFHQLQALCTQAFDMLSAVAYYKTGGYQSPPKSDPFQSILKQHQQTVNQLTTLRRQINKMHSCLTKQNSRAAKPASTTIQLQSRSMRQLQQLQQSLQRQAKLRQSAQQQATKVRKIMNELVPLIKGKLL